MMPMRRTCYAGCKSLPHLYPLWGEKGDNVLQYGNLGVVEKKVLGALMILANEEGIVKTRYKDIADIIGYKECGGALTFAVRILERDNFVVRTAKQTYKLLL